MDPVSSMRPNAIGWALVALFGIGGASFALWLPVVRLLGLIWIGVSLLLAGVYLNALRGGRKRGEI